MSGLFDTLTIQEQIDFIKGDLQTGYWASDSKILAVFYDKILLELNYLVLRLIRYSVF